MVQHAHGGQFLLHRDICTELQAQILQGHAALQECHRHPTCNWIAQCIMRGCSGRGAPRLAALL